METNTLQQIWGLFMRGSQQAKNAAVQSHHIETSASTDTSNNRKTCPECGHHLDTIRIANGENKGKKLFGCSTYPDCRYISEIVD